MASKNSMKNMVDGAVDKSAKGRGMYGQSDALGGPDSEGSSMAGSPRDVSPGNPTPNELQAKSKVPADAKSPAKGTMRKAAVSAAPSTPNVDTREQMKKAKGGSPK